MILADISLGDVLWSTIVIFFMIVYFMILFHIIFDIFRSRDMGGVAKAVWLIAILILPVLTMFIYLIARGGKMQERAIEDQTAARAQMDDYIRQTTGKSAAEEIATAKQLLDSGAITAEEFDNLKAKAMQG